MLTLKILLNTTLTEGFQSGIRTRSCFDTLHSSLPKITSQFNDIYHTSFKYSNTVYYPIILNLWFLWLWAHYVKKHSNSGIAKSYLSPILLKYNEYELVKYKNTMTKRLYKTNLSADNNQSFEILYIRYILGLMKFYFCGVVIF